MPIDPFDTHHDIVTLAVVVRGLANGKIDRLALTVTVADHTPFVVHDVPAILGRVVVNTKSMFRATLFCDGCFLSAHGAEPVGYSLYIRSIIGSPISRASISSGRAPQARSSSMTKGAIRIPMRVER